MNELAPEKISASLLETESLSASLAAKALEAAFAPTELLSVAIAESEAMKGGMHALGVERYYAGSVGVTVKAGASISALKCCYVEEGVASVLASGDVEHSQTFAGVSLNAAQKDGDITLMASGVLEDSSWSWTANKPLFDGDDGRLTQTPPASGFLQQIAIPLTATKILISPKNPVSLI